MLKRIATAAILIPIVVLVVYWGPSWLVAALAAVVGLLAMFEFFKLTSQMGLRAFRLWTMICAVGLFFVQWTSGAAEVHTLGANTLLIQGLPSDYASIEAVFLTFLFGTACIAVLGKIALADLLPGICASAAAFLFVALPFSYVARMDGARSGPVLVLFALVVVWAGDTVAYFVGKSIGRLKMAPALSPKKTWEGAAGNVLGSLIVGYCFARWQNGDWVAWLATAALANIAGQVGDLVESAYKRGAGVKDSGAMLPGHGGMLDRIDSLIFAAPVVWLAAGWLLQNRP
ncbi:MAG TPA: phosphatidate cytidylyltransferase [Candidatus Acidoferrales bacterium]|nr:phosphatidate cytidylyltransferase [Candidatus Acidoferrales bacterium]